MKAFRLALGNLAILLALLATCAGVGEAMLRGTPTPNDVVVRESGTKYRFNPYRPDGVLGYSLRPDWETVHQTEEFSVTVRTNALGLRGSPARAEKPSGVYRILVLGDSFAFGWGVEADESFPALLEAALTPPPGFERVEVLNAGVSGWSADHYGLYLKTRGLALEPDLVLVVPSGNDLSDLVWNRLTLDEAGAPMRIASTLRMIDQNGRMRYLDGNPLELPRFGFPGQPWLSEHSVLYHWLRYRLARLWLGWWADRAETLRGEMAGVPPEGPIPSLDAEEITRGVATGRGFQLRYHRHLMADLEATAAARGVPVRSLLVTRPAASKKDSVVAELRDACAAEPHCLPTESILAGLPEDELFFEVDGHWTPAGHRTIAAALARFLSPLP